MSAKKRWGRSVMGAKKLNSGDMHPKRRIKQTPPTSKFKGLNSSQLRKLQKEN